MHIIVTKVWFSYSWYQTIYQRPVIQSYVDVRDKISLLVGLGKKKTYADAARQQNAPQTKLRQRWLKTKTAHHSVTQIFSRMLLWNILCLPSMQWWSVHTQIHANIHLPVIICNGKFQLPDAHGIISCYHLIWYQDNWGLKWNNVMAKLLASSGCTIMDMFV